MTAPIDQEQAMAYLDGELDELSAGRVARAIAEDPALRTAADEQRRLRELLAQRYDPALEEEVPERLRALLETNVVPLPPRGPAIGWRQFAAMAATFVVGILTAQILPGGGAETGGVEGGPLVARGALAHALDTQLASEQGAGAPARIGVSFASSDGRFCRTFETAAVAGLACRGTGGWKLVTAASASGSGGGEYRQAASAEALALQAAEEMMAGAPLDAAAERRARDAGWRAAER